jgi:hypothetical protein
LLQNSEQETTMLNSSVERVPRSTSPEINERIRRQTLANLARYRGMPAAAVEARLEALKQEWDIERAIEANAAAIALVGVILGAFASPWFLILPALVCIFLLQHALQGWCPPVPILRRLGFRTQPEIEAERLALRRMRDRR